MTMGADDRAQYITGLLLASMFFAAVWLAWQFLS